MPAARAQIALKRAYDEPADADGFRVLVDRLWPRGLTKDAARIDIWLRDLAPSNELRKWFHAHPEQRQEFRERYVRELQSPSAAEALIRLQELLSHSRRVTLVFASKNVEHNNATVLKEVLEGEKPPTRSKTAHRTKASPSRKETSQ
jgi:uncharacterized protein YeaO (DUF488 family)